MTDVSSQRSPPGSAWQHGGVDLGLAVAASGRGVAAFSTRDEHDEQGQEKSAETTSAS
jgi:hypothetical protein